MNNKGENNDAEMIDAETRGKKLGARVAAVYDLFAFSKTRANYIVGIFPPKLGESVLELGCGTGELALRLKQIVGENGTVVATDASAAMVKRTRSKVEKSSYRITCRVAAIEELPFPDQFFDHVFASLMIHHLPSDLKFTGFVEVKRVLKPGGIFHIVDLAKVPFWGKVSAFSDEAYKV